MNSLDLYPSMNGSILLRRVDPLNKDVGQAKKGLARGYPPALF
jgi:hypothetical protein